MSLFSKPPLDKPINTSTSLRASIREPFLFSLLVILDIFSLDSSKFSLPLYIIPLLSHKITSSTGESPASTQSKAFVTATPAAPAPDITTFSFLKSFFKALAAFNKAAKTTISVPC